MFCAKCGKWIDDGMAFCPHCGERVQVADNGTDGSVPQPTGGGTDASVPQPTGGGSDGSTPQPTGGGSNGSAAQSSGGGVTPGEGAEAKQRIDSPRMTTSVILGVVLGLLTPMLIYSGGTISRIFDTALILVPWVSLGKTIYQLVLEKSGNNVLSILLGVSLGFVAMYVFVWVVGIFAEHAYYVADSMSGYALWSLPLMAIWAAVIYLFSGLANQPGDKDDQNSDGDNQSQAPDSAQQGGNGN